MSEVSVQVGILPEAVGSSCNRITVRILNISVTELPCELSCPSPIGYRLIHGAIELGVHDRTPLSTGGDTYKVGIYVSAINVSQYTW